MFNGNILVGIDSYFLCVFKKNFNARRVVRTVLYIYDGDKNVCGCVEFGYWAPVFLKFYCPDVYRLENLMGINHSIILEVKSRNEHKIGTDLKIEYVFLAYLSKTIFV